MTIFSVSNALPCSPTFGAVLLATSQLTDAYQVHRILLLASMVTKFGSAELNPGLTQVRRLNSAVCPPEPEQWALPYVQAAFRVWWLAEYSGHYLDDIEDETIVSPTTLDKGKHFGATFLHVFTGKLTRS